MANPVIVSCSEGQWTEVATSITTGMLWTDVWADINNKKHGVSYFQTYRITGDPAPISTNEEVSVLEKGMPISSTDPIDVYIYCSGGNGSVRIDA
jgi:hypothetical protein